MWPCLLITTAPPIQYHQYQQTQVWAGMGSPLDLTSLTMGSQWPQGQKPQDPWMTDLHLPHSMTWSHETVLHHWQPLALIPVTWGACLHRLLCSVQHSWTPPMATSRPHLTGDTGPDYDDNNAPVPIPQALPICIHLQLDHTETIENNK